MRHDMTTYTPTSRDGSWELRCTCGGLWTITRAGVVDSGRTVDELLAEIRRDHRLDEELTLAERHDRRVFGRID